MDHSLVNFSSAVLSSSFYCPEGDGVVFTLRVLWVTEQDMMCPDGLDFAVLCCLVINKKMKPNNWKTFESFLIVYVLWDSKVPIPDIHPSIHSV